MVDYRPEEAVELQALHSHQKVEEQEHLNVARKLPSHTAVAATPTVAMTMTATVMMMMREKKKNGPRKKKKNGMRSTRTVCRYLLKARGEQPAARERATQS